MQILAAKLPDIHFTSVISYQEEYFHRLASPTKSANMFYLKIILYSTHDIQL